MKKIITMLVLLCVTAFAQQKGTFTDPRDKKTYKTVKIGEQTWMAENLKYVSESNDSVAMLMNFMGVYKWEDAMLACPDGWHLPNYDEWQTLVNFAGGGIAGQKLKAKSGWKKWDCEKTATDDRGRPKKISKCNSDNFGFSALPDLLEDEYASWWTAAESYSNATIIVMRYDSEGIFVNSTAKKSSPFSVRCLKGEGKLPSELIAKRNALAAEEAQKKQEKAMEAANPLTTEVTDDGTILRGSTLAKKLAWLDRNADSHNTYIIEVNADENIEPYKFEYKNAINITIILRGDNENRTIRLKSHGNMFIVNANVTLILDGNITLKGHSGNDNALIYVDGGILTMNAGTTVNGNSGVGVVVGRNYGNSGTFTMNGGTISNNGSYGVQLTKGTFTLNEGIISGNNGSGVVVSGGTFTMRDGTISGNKSSNGGGVYVDDTFIMRGGTIASNTARENGGGVYVRNYKTFTKTGGTITGYNSDRSTGNIVEDEDGLIARKGHAVSYDGSKKRKETTAKPDDNLSCERSKCTGAWDD